MSVIIPGDSVSALGEFLPTPFIDKIIVQGEGVDSYFSITVSVHMPNDSIIEFASGGAAVSQKSKYTAAMSELRYYIMLSFLDEYIQTDYTYAENVATWHDKLKDGTINPMAYALGPGLWYKSYDLSRPARRSSATDSARGPGYVIEFEPFDGSITPIETTDEEGNEILKYSVTMDIKLDDPFSTGASAYHILHDSAFQEEGWNAIYDMDLYAFSSTLNFNEDYAGMYGTYIEASSDTNARREAFYSGSITAYPKLEMKTSAVSYEKVFEQANIADRANVEYVDSESVMYAKTPLISIDSIAYKINKVTHEQIVEKIQGILERYQTYYDMERGFDKLKNMYDGISTIITKYGLDAYLLPRLATFQRAWPDKVPAKPVGKMYKDLRKNIFTINKTIKQGQRLYPVVRYSGKVIDLRPLPTPEPYVSLHDYEWEGKMDEYIYDINWITKMDVERVEGFGLVSVVYAAGLFDYEKALAYTSQASKFVDLLKLASYGLPIPYSMFSISQIQWLRADEGNDELVKIKSYSGGTLSSAGDMDDADSYDVEYPYTKWVRIANLGIEKRVRRKISDGIPSDESEDATTSDTSFTKQYLIDDQYVATLPGTPYYTSLITTAVGAHASESAALEGYPNHYIYIEDGASDGASSYTLTKPALPADGYLTSCTIRPYVNPAAAPISETIEDYRLILFDLLDYMKESTAAEYEVSIAVVDNTSDVLISLAETFFDAVDTVSEYYEMCVEECSFNADTEVFNSFFAESIIDYYDGDIESAPWYRAPYVYCLHRDLHYDSYGGDMEEIKKAAVNLSAQINPVEGTLAGVAAFHAAITELSTAVYFGDMGTYGHELHGRGVSLDSSTTNTYEIVAPIPDSYSCFTSAPPDEAEGTGDTDTGSSTDDTGGTGDTGGGTDVEDDTDIVEEDLAGDPVEELFE